MTDTSGSQHSLAIRSGGVAVVVTLAGVLVHFVVTVFLVFALISSAYAYARAVPGGGDVSSYDQLYKLGGSPMAGFAGLALTGAVSFFVSVGLLPFTAPRPRAWMVPVVGIGLSILIWITAVALFQPPPPDIGG